MPHAVTHILVVLVLVELIRDYYVENKKEFSLHYVLIAGIASVIPDIDIVVYWLLYFFGFAFNEIHRTFSHTIFIPLIFLIISGIFYSIKDKKINNITKKNLKLHIIFLMLSIGTIIHLILDSIFYGYIMPLYPLSSFKIGLNLIALLPIEFQNMFFPTLDGVVLIFWLIHEEIKHKISSFI